MCGCEVSYLSKETKQALSKLLEIRWKIKFSSIIILVVMLQYLGLLWRYSYMEVQKENVRTICQLSAYENLFSAVSRYSNRFYVHIVVLRLWTNNG